MNMRLSYILRFFILSLTILCAEYSYALQNYAETQASIHKKEQDFYTVEHQKIMNHYDKMIKQTTDPLDSGRRDKLQEEVRLLKSVYDDYMAVYSLYCTLHEKYAPYINYHYYYCERKKENCIDEIYVIETHINEISKRKKSELLSYSTRNGLIKVLKSSKPEYFNEYSLNMLDEYYALLPEYLDYLDTSSSVSDANIDRFIYLMEEEMPKLILSLRDSMKKEIPVIREEIERLDSEKQIFMKKIYPYYEILEIYNQLSSAYSKLRNKYLLLHRPQI